MPACGLRGRAYGAPLVTARCRFVLESLKCRVFIEKVVGEMIGCVTNIRFIEQGKGFTNHDVGVVDTVVPLTRPV